MGDKLDNHSAQLARAPLVGASLAEWTVESFRPIAPVFANQIRPSGAMSG